MRCWGRNVGWASSFETHRFAMLLRMRTSDPHGEERVFARLEP